MPTAIHVSDFEQYRYDLFVPTAAGGEAQPVDGRHSISNNTSQCMTCHWCGIWIPIPSDEVLSEEEAVSPGPDAQVAQPALVTQAEFVQHDSHHVECLESLKQCWSELVSEEDSDDTVSLKGDGILVSASYGDDRIEFLLGSVQVTSKIECLLNEEYADICDWTQSLPELFEEGYLRLSGNPDTLRLFFKAFGDTIPPWPIERQQPQSRMKRYIFKRA
jgi:hypothetical protein